MQTNLEIRPTICEKGRLSRELRTSIGVTYGALWVGATVLAASGFRLGMALQLALPWIGLVAVVLFPRDFTLLRNFGPVPVGLAFGWLIMSPAHLGLPVYTSFIGPDDRFLRFGLGPGGIFTAIVLATARLEERNSVICFTSCSFFLCLSYMGTLQ